MIEMTLEEDLPEEFRGGTLRINPEAKLNDNSSKPNSPETDNKDITDNESVNANANNNCNWGFPFSTPLTSIPNKISESIFSKSNSKQLPSPKKENSLQQSICVKEDANNFFTFRDGVVEKAVKECVEQFLDLEKDGALISSFLLTQINHWDTDKERLVLLTEKTLVVAKYDFIALKRLGYKKLPLDVINDIIIGDLIYPSTSLIPRINGFADGLSNVLENCLFSRWSKTEKQHLDNLYQPRDRNMKGIRIMFNKGEPINFKTIWNPFTEDVPFWTFTFHPLYFHKDCTDENLRKLYNLENFIDNLSTVILNFKKNEEYSMQFRNILLDNYVGLGSVIHNRNSLGFFKVRGKFSF